ncbi:hypothetical protein CEY00_Acc19125 [Actinidia chinensis var. chinensis]|uniref:Nuclease associated modular domain-containing protein n=1 Tax=Actinidia chinensis var. chinensis TaxID=1590841 RepID=A0A2R6QCM3_ACTCC|nr:hypothetical protein CEY00_Acc19125 [Actinidia chinensis var. chinensis]
MSFSHLRLSVPSLPIHGLPNPSLSPLLYYMVYCTQVQAITKQSICQVSLVNNKSPSFALVSSLTGMHASQALNIVDRVETSDVSKSESQTFTDEVQFYSSSNSAEGSVDEDQKEIRRRRKIGLANRGKVPWNKGKKHSKETCERIRHRTKEAMMDPKIRKKMSETHRRPLSDQTKANIRTALRRMWGERLKLKKSREKFLSPWAERIAEAARKGASGQQELQWDSYDKIKGSWKWAAVQAKAKEAAKVRATQAKAEKMARLAEKRKELERKAKAREVKRKNRKSKEEREELLIAQGLKLKEKLTKIHKRKASANGQIACEDQRAWEKLDLEFIKGEHTQREVSLADQIRAAKSKK